MKGAHPAHLKSDELATFLQDMLGIQPLSQGQILRQVPRQNLRQRKVKTIAPEIVSCYFLLPSAKGEPLPSWEMAQYLETELPEKIDWNYWQIDCYPCQVTGNSGYPVNNIVRLLHELQFLTQHRLVDVQLGTDLLFWYHYTQSFKQIIFKDQYIPALKYRSTTPPSPETSGRKRKAAIAETLEVTSKVRIA